MDISEHMNSPPSGISVPQYLVSCVVFIDQYLSFCPFFVVVFVCFVFAIVLSSSIYGCRLPFWHLQTRDLGCKFRITNSTDEFRNLQCAIGKCSVYITNFYISISKSLAKYESYMAKYESYMET